MPYLYLLGTASGDGNEHGGEEAHDRPYDRPGNHTSGRRSD